MEEDIYFLKESMLRYSANSYIEHLRKGVWVVKSIFTFFPIWVGFVGQAYSCTVIVFFASMLSRIAINLEYSFYWEIKILWIDLDGFNNHVNHFSLKDNYQNMKQIEQQ